MDKCFEFVFESIREKIESVEQTNKQLCEDNDCLEKTKSKLHLRIRDLENRNDELRSQSDRFENIASSRKGDLNSIYQKLKYSSNTDGKPCDIDKLPGFVENVIDQSRLMKTDIEKIFQEILKTDINALNHFLISPEPTIRKHVEKIYKVREALEKEDEEAS